MSIMTELFVADPADAPGYEKRSPRDHASGRFEVREFGGLTSLEFEVLWAIIEGKDWTPKQYSLEHVVKPGQQWLCRFPPPFVEMLAALTPKDLGAIAEKWAAIEELSCSAEQIYPVLDGLVSLAKSAKAKGRGLFLWGSL
jgi:hypothetical protein